MPGDFIPAGPYVSASATGLVADAINDGTTTVAPSQNAVFDALALKAPLNSPGLTGTPTAPTAPPGTDSTQIATTAFVLANAPSATAVSTVPATTGLDPASTDVEKALTELAARPSGGGPLRPTAPAGSWWELVPSHSDFGTAGTFAPSTASSNGYGLLAFVPMSHDQPIDGMTFWLNAPNDGASASARLMLWAADAGSHHGPGAAIPAPSAIGSATGAAGERVVTWSTPVVLPAPGFWFALVPQDLDTSGTNPAFWVYPNIGERRGWSPPPVGNNRTPRMTVTGLTTGETPDNPTVSTTYTNGSVPIAAVSVRSAT